MRDNESLREFGETIWPSRTPNRGLQHGCCPTDLQKKHLSGTPFFESLAKKPPTTMDDLFRLANKYSMLEDDVRAATQQVLVAGQASRDNADRHAKPPDRPKPVDRWPRPLETDPSIRDRSKKCAFHKDHGHITETCRSLQYLVERLIKAGHLKQYLRSDTGGRDVSQHHNSGAPRAPVAPKAVINYINGDPSDEEYDSRHGTIIFPPVDPTRTLQPHRDALILSLEIGDFDSRGVSKPRTNLYPDSTRSSTTSLGDIILPVQAGPVTLNVQFSVVQELSPFNVILGRTWLHYMKAIPSTYHQMVSFLTDEGQTDLYGSQLAARQCYQIAREAVANQEDASPPEPSIGTRPIAIIGSGGQRSPGSGSLQTIQISEENDHLTNISSLMTQEETQSIQNILRSNQDIFAWTHSDMKGIHPSIASHTLTSFQQPDPFDRR
ncbi:hypothetical protein CK203_018843 [Vitis vinifera]|uniref:Retrotransposon gag domain-containing protein n=1 Tax=Vitis vinifera TaxID=29760 RepID=A0A438JAY0_VITVI|nr:hypothetical protein CK203_018843 [Vitis vinifera]